MTDEVKLLENVKNFFSLMLPAGGNQRQFYNAAQWRDDFFELFMEVQNQGRFSSEQMRDHVNAWFEDRVLNDNDQDRIEDMLHTWDDWLYAKQRLSEKQSP
jgi:hypothetical protein